MSGEYDSLLSNSLISIGSLLSKEGTDEINNVTHENVKLAYHRLRDYYHLLHVLYASSSSLPSAASYGQQQKHMNHIHSLEPTRGEV